jgi:type IV pilus assembly protein PilV
MTPGATRRRIARRRPRNGLTVIEVVMAMMLLGFGLLGLAGVSLSVTKQYRSSTYQETAALIVQSRLDSLASIRCQALAASGTQTGTATKNGVTEKWVVADGNDVKLISDTVRFPSRTRALVYKSIIPCRD